MNIAHPHSGHAAPMKLTPALIRGLIIVACTLLACIAYFKIAGWRRDDLVIPDEKAVALAMLEKQFEGPRYFHQRPGDPQKSALAGEAGIFINADSAAAQERRIIEERHLSPENAARLHRLIAKLTEPPPSRLYSERINLVRLNLALDELK